MDKDLDQGWIMALRIKNGKRGWIEGGEHIHKEVDRRIWMVDKWIRAVRTKSGSRDQDFKRWIGAAARRHWLLFLLRWLHAAYLHTDLHVHIHSRVLSP